MDGHAQTVEPDLPGSYVNASEFGGRPTLARADSAYRRSLYRGLLNLLVDLFSEAVPPTRRCGSAFPLVRQASLVLLLG
jgi:hypothetical protein